MLRLPELLKCKTIRQSIERLDISSTERLRTDEEWRRAYVILSFLAHAYVWGGDLASEVGRLPSFGLLRASVNTKIMNIDASNCLLPS